FATGGSGSVAYLGGEIKNPGKNIPICMILGTTIVAIVYAGIGLVAGGVMPLDQVANQNLAVVAQSFLSRPLFVFFILFGALGAIATTINSTFMWVTKPLLAACNDFKELGWLPRTLGAVNKKYNTPHYLLIMFYLIGVVPLLFGISLTTVSSLGTGIMLLMAALPLASTGFLYKKYPEDCKHSYFILKPGMLKLFAILSASLAVVQSAMLFGDLTPKVLAITITYVALSFLLAHFLDKKHHVQLYSGDYRADFYN
ncbi:MAG: amino acid permease, partial [Pygmaiobacter sp.]